MRLADVCEQLSGKQDVGNDAESERYSTPSGDCNYTK